MILLDTHAWVWFVSNPELLSRRATAKINKSVKDKGVLVSAISSWEIALLVAKKRMKLTMDVAEWITRCEKLPFMTFIPVDNRIAVKSVNLPGRLHRDPADRIIVATAIETGATLITKDDRMLNYSHVKAAW